MTESRRISYDERDGKMTRVVVDAREYTRRRRPTFSEFYVWNRHAQQVSDGEREKIPVAFRSKPNRQGVTITPIISEGILESITKKLITLRGEGD